MKNIEVRLSPRLLDSYQIKNKIVVVVDILRATSIITTMFKNGLSKLIPVQTLEEAKDLKKNEGILVAAERDGKKVDFADFDNSPFTFTQEKIKGKVVVYSSTNGTNTINNVKNAQMVLIASFLNLNAIVDFLKNQNSDVLILCSGWQGNYCTEDALCAGALSEALLSGQYETNCDSVSSAIDLWKVASLGLLKYAKRIHQYKRLLNLGLKEEIMKYCFSRNITDSIPALENDYIIDIKNLE